MHFINSLICSIMRTRIPRVEVFMKYPHEVQEDCFRSLIGRATSTEWGKKYHYATIRNQEDFAKLVPLSYYEDLKPYIDRMRKGESNILWPKLIKWFAKSSGTTSDKSKFIPVSKEALYECHFKGGKDLVAIYCNNHPNSRLFTGKILGMSGSHNQFSPGAISFDGDISAILLQHLPTWLDMMRTPERSVALMPDWEEKIEIMTQTTTNQNVTNLTGVPSWMMLLLKRILEATQKQNIGEVWPNLELFVHGGVNFEPYREQFHKIMPATICYLDTYNASEGFFGMQYQDENSDLLLMLDYGIYYEFISLDELEKEQPKTLQLYQVELNTPYAMVISTNAGLWRYIIGDTVRFTNLSPYCIRITGRTKNFINAVGEELMIENAETAIALASKTTNALVTEFTAAPTYFSDDNNAAHEWLIEFEKPPDDLDLFTKELDNSLKKLNSDYEAKRYRDLILRLPIVRVAKPNTFYTWMKSKGKIGGQHKVPRLSNDRKHVEEILKLIDRA